MVITMKKKILMIGTGGTISSRDEGQGLLPGMQVDELMKYCPKIKELCDVDCVQPIFLDSTNIRPGHWIKIADTIQNSYNDYDGFVITHGTDTMAYTASGLSYLLQNCRKPIVLTGSQMPISEPGSDAIRNLTDAFICACDDNSHNVIIVFFGSVIAGTRARKNYSRSYAAFGSVNFPEIAKIVNGSMIHFVSEDIAGEPDFYDYLNPNVGVLKFVPGLRTEILQSLIEQYDGLVIESFGVGGLPEYSDYFEQISRASEQGKLIVMTTQVANEGSDLSVYKVGAKVKNNLKVLEAYDMTTESAFAKLMWILGITTDFREAQKYFYKTVNHDILCNHI